MSFQRLIRTKSPPHRFTRVKNTEFDKEGNVEEFMDVQFTVNYDDGSFGFLFYTDKGDTWHPLDEVKKSKATRGKSSFAQYVNDMGISAPTGMVWAQNPPHDGNIMAEMIDIAHVEIPLTDEEIADLGAPIPQEELTEEEMAVDLQEPQI